MWKRGLRTDTRGPTDPDTVKVKEEETDVVWKLYPNDLLIHRRGKDRGS